MSTGVRSAEGDALTVMYVHVDNPKNRSNWELAQVVEDTYEIKLKGKSLFKPSFKCG